MGKYSFPLFLQAINDIYWIFPLTLDNIQIEPDKVKYFVDSLFSQKTGIMHNTNLKHLLAASVMIFHESFIGIIGNEPSGNYKYPNHHPFRHKTICVPSETIISMETFRKWQNEFIEGFNNKD